MTDYTKEKWKFKREEYIVNDVFSSIEAGDIKICYLKEPHYIPDTGDRTWYNGKVEVMKANAHLIVTAVNACIELNPNNPIAVAESIKDMYEALKKIKKQGGWVYQEDLDSIHKALAKGRK